MPDREGTILALDDLEHTPHAHELVGADHGNVPFSLILVHSQPGVGPRLHRHPYPEVFVVESGQATFRIGEAVGGGDPLAAPFPAVEQPAARSNARTTATPAAGVRIIVVSTSRSGPGLRAIPCRSGVRRGWRPAGARPCRC